MLNDDGSFIIGESSGLTPYPTVYLWAITQPVSLVVMDLEVLGTPEYGRSGLVITEVIDQLPGWVGGLGDSGENQSESAYSSVL